MLLSAFHPLTLLDYPGKTACIVFTVGCNFRCGFCHNPDFVLPERIMKIKDSFVATEAFFEFLERRVGLLDGVVICGGEPTVQANIEPFIRRIKSLGFLVKLDTNGSNPEVLKKLLFPAEGKPLIDMVAMDIKRDIETYGNIKTLMSSEELPSIIRESIALLDASGIELEFRTTVAKGVHTPEMIRSIIREIPARSNYALQNFRNGNILNPDFSGSPFTDAELE